MARDRYLGGHPMPCIPGLPGFAGARRLVTRPRVGWRVAKPEYLGGLGLVEWHNARDSHCRPKGSDTIWRGCTWSGPVGFFHRRHAYSKSEIYKQRKQTRNKNV